MKRASFIILCISVHIACIFIQINQYSRTIKASYQKQKNETFLAQLKQKKQELTHHVYALHNKSKVKKFATEALKMEPLSLNHIKKLPNHDKQTV